MVRRREPRRVAVKDAAFYLGISEPAVVAWANRDGAPTVMEGKRRLLVWPDFPLWRMEELIRQAKREAAPKDFEAARVRKLALEAELLERELRQLDGSLVTVDDCAQATEEEWQTLRAQFLSLPSRMAAECLSAKTLPAMVATLDREVRRMLSEVSATTPEV